VVGQIPVERLGGVTETGAAGGTHAVALVVKVHTALLARLLPYMSCAPVVIVAVYSVLKARLRAGVKIAVSLEASKVTTPATAAVPGPVTVKVEPSIDAGFIGLLKVAVTIELGQAPAAPLGGVREVTTGELTVGFVPDLS
jgi:uncharacterized protein (DUF58 family)